MILGFRSDSNAAQDNKLHRLPLQEQTRLPVCAGQLPAVPGALPGLQLPQPQHLHHLIPQDQWVSHHQEEKGGRNLLLHRIIESDLSCSEPEQNTEQT